MNLQVALAEELELKEQFNYFYVDWTNQCDDTVWSLQPSPLLLCSNLAYGQIYFLDYVYNFYPYFACITQFLEVLVSAGLVVPSSI